MTTPESAPDLHRPETGLRRVLRVTHGLLWDLNNLLLIPVFSFIVVELIGLGLGVEVRDVDGLEPLHLIICGLFFTEWAIGLVLAPRRRVYLRDPARIADLVSSIPVGYFAQGIRMVRMTRVLRLLRVVWRIRRVRGQLREVIRVAGLVTAVAVSGAGALRMLEPGTVTTFGEAMWWSIVTMSTVGYGDISPVTPAGRGVAMGMIVVGIAIFGYAISVLTSVVVVPEEDDDLKDILLRMEDRLDRLEARLEGGRAERDGLMRGGDRARPGR